MTMPIRAMGVCPPDQTSTPAHDRGGPVRSLARALKTGDLAAASTAYATLAAKAPHRAERNPDGAFARIGTALAAGDLAGARAAFASIFAGHRPGTGEDTPATPASDRATIAPVRSGPGALLDVSA